MVMTNDNPEMENCTMTSNMKEKDNTVALGEIAGIGEILIHEIRAEDLIATDKFWKKLRGGTLSESEMGQSYFVTPFDAVAHPTYMLPKYGTDQAQLLSQKIKLSARVGGQDHVVDPVDNSDPIWSEKTRCDDFLLTKRLVVRCPEDYLPEYIQMILEDFIDSADWEGIKLPDMAENNWKLEVGKDKESFSAVCARLKACLINETSPSPKEQEKWNALFDALRGEEIDPLFLNKKIFPKLFSENLPLPGCFFSDLPRLIGEYNKRIAPVFLEPGLLDQYLMQDDPKPYVYGDQPVELTGKEKKERAVTQENNLAFDALEAWNELDRFLQKYFPENAGFGVTPQSGVPFANLILVARIWRSRLPLKMLFDGAKKRMENNILAKEKSERLLRFMAHEVKGLISAMVIDPLQLMLRQGQGDSDVVDDALRGTRLLREMVNAVNLASVGADEDMRKKDQEAVRSDVADPDDGAMTFSSILFHSLKAACSNMFDNRNFNKYFKVHFSASEAYLRAREHFMSIQNNDLDELGRFCSDHLAIRVDQKDLADEVGSLSVGNANNSALKMLVLFQEVIQNAVKYVSLVDKKRRKICFRAKVVDDEVSIEVVNACNADGDVEDTKVGAEIINGIGEQFGECSVGLVEPRRDEYKFVLSSKLLREGIVRE